MCRSIKRLREGTDLATNDEIEAAALQFVRKISGFRQPTRRHEEAFESAVKAITSASEHLLESISAEMATNGASART
jgi:hypothetical protein